MNKIIPSEENDLKKKIISRIFIDSTGNVIFTDLWEDLMPLAKTLMPDFSSNFDEELK